MVAATATDVSDVEDYFIGSAKSMPMGNYHCLL